MDAERSETGTEGGAKKRAASNQLKEGEGKLETVTPRLIAWHDSERHKP